MVCFLSCKVTFWPSRFRVENFFWGEGRKDFAKSTQRDVIDPLMHFRVLVVANS